VRRNAAEAAGAGNGWGGASLVNLGDLDINGSRLSANMRVFNNIPALPLPVLSRSFVFIDIPASFLQKKIFFSRLISSPELQDKLSE
jgi:hypothetical protein